MNIQETRFSFFEGGIRNVKSSGALTLPQCLDLLKSDRYRDLTNRIRHEGGSEIKTQLDYVTFSGLFSKRENKGLAAHSTVYLKNAF